jgi:hypothetical protein
LSSDTDLESVWRAAIEIVPRFFTALQAVERQGEDTSGLLSVVSDLRHLQDQVHTDRPRPWRRWGRGVRTLLGHIRRSLELFLTSFQADDPLAVQEIAAAAQEALDAAGSWTFLVSVLRRERHTSGWDPEDAEE